MKEGGLVCVLQVGRGWYCELVPIFDETGCGEREGDETRRFKCPVALKYPLSKEGKKDGREREEKRRMKPSVKKKNQVGVMKGDNNSILSGHVDRGLARQPSWPVTTISMTTQRQCV